MTGYPYLENVEAAQLTYRTLLSSLYDCHTPYSPYALCQGLGVFPSGAPANERWKAPETTGEPDKAIARYRMGSNSGGDFPAAIQGSHGTK